MDVIAPSRWSEGVKRELACAPIENLAFHFVREREWPMRLGWSLGSALRYFIWQWHASKMALELDATQDFDVIHHVSYGTLLGGSFLWRLGKPFVFGPAGGGQTAPPAFLSYFGRFQRSEALRTIVTKHLWRLDWPAIQTARSASVVLASNRETAVLAGRMGARRVEFMFDVYLPDDVIPPAPNVRVPRKPVKLLWVGRLLARKGQQLTVEALDLVPASVPVELEIVGDGPVVTEFREWLASADLVHRVKLSGRIPWNEVHRAYDSADVFIFTSLRDTVGIQLLEAMAHALPVITLDHQGAADLVPNGAGIKVPVTSPSEARQGIATAIETLAASCDLRVAMGAAAHRRALAFTLSRRIQDLEALYASVVRGACGRSSCGLGPCDSRMRGFRPGRRTTVTSPVKSADVVVEAGSPFSSSAYAAEAHADTDAKPAQYVDLNERQPESERDTFTPERYAQFARHLPADVKVALDVGCGVGRGGKVLKRGAPALRLLGLDCVGDRIARVPAGVYDRLLCANSMAIAIDDESVDAIVAGEFIEHLSDADVDRTLLEFARVLRPGGRLLMTTPNPAYWRFHLTGRSVLGGAHLSKHPPVELAARLRRRGFCDVSACGSGRWSRYLGERFPCRAAYGSYMVMARRR